MDVLNTTELNNEIEDMFKREKAFLLILSPYLQIHKKLETILSMSKANITIVYRECKNADEIKNNLSNVTFLQVNNLHAKAYISQTHTIITSLNMYEYSQINNFELGVLIENEKEEKLTNKIKEEILYLFKENNFDLTILDKFNRHYSYGDLYYFLVEKYGVNTRKYENFYNATTIISDELKNNFPHNEKDLRDDKSFLFSTKITKEMYDYGIEKIIIKKYDA
jgi:hypothetical protein